MTKIIEGYLKVAPAVMFDGDVATIDSQSVYYRQLNEAVRDAIAAGAKTVRLTRVNGQRYIGTGVAGSDVRIEIDGVPGSDMAIFMDGPTVVVSGNAQDGVGNTMNAGRVIINGDAGDVIGYGMRGGTVLIRGDVGYRVGIHMKAYESMRPTVVCGGKARDFFGEYMAGGMLVLLGMDTQFPDQPLVGSFCGTGMHGGKMYLRCEELPIDLPVQVEATPATAEDMAEIDAHLDSFCESFDLSKKEVLSKPFFVLRPNTKNPYKSLYTFN